MNKAAREQRAKTSARLDSFDKRAEQEIDLFIKWAKQELGTTLLMICELAC